SAARTNLFRIVLFAQRSAVRFTEILPPLPLPEHLHAELHLPLIERPGDRAERRVAAIGGRRREVRAVEQVERLEPQLQPCRPAERDVLAGGQIELPEAGAAHGVA